jgi:hypothetical protein
MVAGALLALVCFGAQWLFFRSLQDLRIWHKAIGVTITVVVAAAVFFGTAYLLRVAEVEDVVKLVRRRLGV